MRKNLLLLLSLFFAVTTFAQSDYLQGWTAFGNNDRNGARKHFEQAIKDADTSPEAYLSLALLDWSESKDKDAFEKFKQFYEKSDNPYPYLYGAFSLPFMDTSNKKLSPSQVDFWEKVKNDPQMNGTLKAMVYEKLAGHYSFHNNKKKADELYRLVGAINKWQVLGAFSNVSGSGYDKDWGAVAKARSTDTFQNNVDATVQWYVPAWLRTDNWLDFSYYFYLEDVIVYAQTFVESPLAQDVYLRTGTSGSLKIWVNDRQIAAVPEERNCDLDIYAYKVHLNQGANRILVQIGQSEINRANFMMRLTDENSNTIAGLTCTGQYSDYVKSAGASTNDMLPFFAESFFERKIEEDPGNILNYIMLGEVYLRNDKSYEGTRTLKQAEQMVSKSSFVSDRLSEAYARGDNQTDYSREIENIKLNDPESFIAIQNFYSDEIQAEKYAEAEKIAAKAKELYGENFITDAMDIQLASVQQKMNELITLVQKLYVKYPHQYEYLQMCYTIEKDIYKNTKKAGKLLEDYCKRYSEPAAIALLARHYMNIGETAKGLAQYRKRIDNAPYAIGFRYEYADILHKMQYYDEALTVLADARRLAPYASYLYDAEAAIHKDKRNVTRAAEYYRKAIYYQPTSYSSRRQLRILEGKPDIFNLFPKEDLGELIAKAPGTEAYPEENALIVMYDNQLVFYPEGAQEYRTELAVKILDASGIEDWKNYWISYNSNNQKLILDKYEVIKGNGQKVKAETDNRGQVVFTNLEVGDVLHLDYRVQAYSTGVLSKHFFNHAVMQHALPAMYIRASILAPADRQFEYRVINGDITPEISEAENMKLYQWVSTDQPAVKYEHLMSAYTDVIPMVVYSSIPGWDMISNWYKDMTENKINVHSDYVLREALSDILKGKEDASQLEKAELFYEYILKNITYSNVAFMQSNFIPQKASRTIVTRLGDCKDVSTLFVAFCRESGIKANLVLLNSRDNGNNVMALPTNYFNHCIAQLDIDGKIYYLELTDNKLPFGAALDADLQSAILPIPYKNEMLGNSLLYMDMPHRMKNIAIRKKDITITGNDMNITYNNVRYGQSASFTRQEYTNMGPEDRLKDMNESLASRWNTPVKVSNLTFTNLDNLTDSVVTSFDLETRNSLQDVAGMKIFRMPWSDAITSTYGFGLEERKYPFLLWAYLYCDAEEETIYITFTDKKKLVEKPANVKLQCAAASYELIFETLPDGRFKATRKFDKLKDVVSPEEYAQFRQFINDVVEYDNKQYAIK